VCVCVRARVAACDSVHVTGVCLPGQHCVVIINLTLTCTPLHTIEAGELAEAALESCRGLSSVHVCIDVMA
jgi:hypothetical protein